MERFCRQQAHIQMAAEWSSGPREKNVDSGKTKCSLYGHIWLVSKRTAQALMSEGDQNLTYSVIPGSVTAYTTQSLNISQSLKELIFFFF